MSKGFIKFGLCIALALLMSGCANQNSGQSKIAVVQWDKAVSAHPLDKKLKIGEGIVKDLIKRRDTQENIARTQLASVNRLQSIKRISAESYHIADINTQMIQKRTMANDLLQKQLKIYEREADEILAQRKEAIEHEYQLEIFNLELARQNTRMKQEALAENEKRVAKAKEERDLRLAQLAKEKQIIVAQKAAPYVASMQKKLQEEQSSLEGAAAQEMAASMDKDAKLLESAPNSLRKALEIMDREIDKQQEKNNKLRKEISADIEKIAVKLAKERGYAIVFNQYKANVKADDITKDIISDLKKIQK